jgi:phospholipid/cholesterol/gamma-HCH transport system ATP-binding protein
VEVRDVSYGYGRQLVLKGIDMTIPRGSVVAIMGISGSGKTTLLRLLAGWLKPRKGTIQVEGEPLHRMGRRDLYRIRKRMGMLFQFGALFTDLSVFDNVAFQIREHTDLDDAMVRDLVMMKLHAVGLRAVHDRMPAELSGGMARRVALARAIALDPTLIMYDEPFTGLDPISLGVIGRLILRLNAALGATSIVVTHDVEEALDLVDYVFYLSDGVMVAKGTPAEIRAAREPLLHQFVYGEPDGPVAYQYPSRSWADDLRIGSMRPVAGGGRLHG